jgi:TolB-like protein/Tfp pilus assembly protein PilF
MPVRFGTFELDDRSRELRDGGRRQRLQEQPYEVLRLLLERPGDVVTREELRQRLWPDGTTVDFEHSLNAAVKRLRAVLGDAAGAPRFVETLPRRGYRFVARVEPVASALVPANPAPLPQMRLAVLPFSNLSDEAAQDFFSDGLTEELISQLGPALRGHVAVIARWSSMAFKGSLRRAHEIGEALRVGYILEGSVRRDGPRVRIVVRLIDTATEADLWSETYERTVTDWLSVQADVASRVARSLVKELVLEPRGGTPDDIPAAAYLAYLKGRFFWSRPADSGLDEAYQYFEQATRLAPRFAAAHGALARVKVASAEYYRAVPRVRLALAREQAALALTLDPTLSEAHGALADVYRHADWDWDAADAGYVQAMVCNPSNETAPRNYGLMLAALGRHAEGVAYLERACDLDPLCFAASLAAGWVFFTAGDLEEAMARCRHLLDMDRQFLGAHRLLGAALLQLGRRDEALAHLQQVADSGSNPVNLLSLAHASATTGRREEAEALVARARSLERDCYVPPYHLAVAYAGLGNVAATLDALEQALVDRDPMIPNLAIDPRFAALRPHPAVQGLLERLDLPTRIRTQGG